jgi:hypothetical protein
VYMWLEAEANAMVCVGGGWRRRSNGTFDKIRSTAHYWVLIPTNFWMEFRKASGENVSCA